jgi:multisubunit Na+/H+ antiporter MnhC subunit
MKRIYTVVAVALVMAAVVVVMAMPAFAAITAVKENGGGNTPNGTANGVPSENQNPSGHAPPGQNP